MNSTFEKSVAILELAYLHGVLEPLSCAACACGNLMAGYNNIAVVKSNIGNNENGYKWQLNGVDVFNPRQSDLAEATWSRFKNQEVDSLETIDDSFTPLDVERIKNLGYTPKQIYDIEQAFMFDEHGDSIIGWTRNFEFKKDGSRVQYDGQDEEYKALIRVVEVLGRIHGIEGSVLEKAKADFGQTQPALVETV